LFATTVRDGCLADGHFFYLYVLTTSSGAHHHLHCPLFIHLSKTQDLDHAVWHLFVLMGSLFHWLGVYFYVIRFNNNNYNAGGSNELLEAILQNATVCTAAS
jgi:hypothetical protein